MTTTRGLILLIGVNIIWGSTYVVAKVAMETIPPALLVSLRFTLATIFFWLILWWRERRRPAGEPSLLAMEPADRWRALLLGLFGMALGYLLGYFGIDLTTATDASLMIIGEVIFTTLLAAILAGERIGRWRRVGMVLGVAGVAILVASSLTEADAGGSGLWRALGDLLVLSGIFCEAIYTVLGAKLVRRTSPLTILAYGYTGSLLLWTPIIGWYVWAGAFPTLTMPATLSVLYLAFLPTVFCNIVWFTVIRHTSANLGALSLFVQPVVGALLGTLVLGDPITIGLLSGAALIFAALYLTTLPDQPNAPHVIIEEPLS